MIEGSSLPMAADPRRRMPDHAGSRLDAIETALRVLGEEDRRFEQLGFERPRQRCREARRFWGFVGAIVAMAEQDSRTVSGKRARG